jgi:hypothetical protein
LHDAEGRDHDVETRLGKSQRLGVSLLERDRQAFRLGTQLAALEQARHIVRGDDFAPAPRGGQSDIAVAGGDVENLLSSADVERFAEPFADNLQRGADHRIVAGGPRALLARLEGLEVGQDGFLAFGCG